MKFKFNQIVLFFFLFYISCSSSKLTTTNTDILQATSLQPVGRYTLNEGQLELITTAAHFGFSFEGTECSVFAYITNASGHNYFQYELDGIYQKKIRIEGNSRQPIVITAPAYGKHSVWIYKTTEAHSGPIFIEKITGKNLLALTKPVAPLIEFIGNSITCGAAADPSEVPCGTGVYHDQHNGYYAYGPRVSRALNTNFIVSGVSGIGIYRTWNMNGPSMPLIYEKTDFQENGQRLWDFKATTPTIVSIALGTNDLSNGDGKNPRPPFDSAIFVSNYIKFVQLVKSKYPNAQIALLSSPMINGDRRIALHNYLSVVKKNIDALYPSNKPVALFFFNPMNARGCSGHPNVEDHAILAEELIPFFKNLL